MDTLYVMLIAATTAWTLAGVAAVHRVRRRRSVASRQPVQSAVGVSVLKPLCGIDNDLEANLRSFFQQDYPVYELVFGVQGQSDPAIEVVKRLRVEFPQVATRLVIHDGGRGINPKVSNLRAMLAAVSHDVVVISDSNIRVAPTYLSEMVAELEQPNVGLVTNLFTGVDERTIGARLENLHLNGVIAAGNAVPTVFLDKPVVVGKSMMFRRSTFERLGGFESVKNLLAEDYVIGRMFHAAGYEIRMASRPVENVCQTTSVPAFVKRHLRWNMIRIRMAPFAFAIEPLATPMLLAVVAPLFGVSIVLPLAWAIVLTVFRDAMQWTMLRGSRGFLAAMLLFPLRDLLVLVAWLMAPFFKHVTWRGVRVRVSAGTTLYAEVEPEPPTMLFVESRPTFTPEFES